MLVQVESPIVNGVPAVSQVIPAVILLEDIAPAFFPFEPEGRKFLAAVQNDGSAFVGPTDLFGGAPLPGGLPIRPAKPGDIIQLFGTGFGLTQPPAPAGQIPTEIGFLEEDVMVLFGGLPAQVFFAGVTTQFAGLYQIVIGVPNVLDGEHQVVAQIAGKQTQQNASITVEDQQ